MLDSIHVGVTGLLAHQQGLRVIANNTANMNTPGYKGATLGFVDLFYAHAQGSDARGAALGGGVTTTGTHRDFRQGELRQSGGEFDLALDGEGLFTLRDPQGANRYTRAGEFEFDANGRFVNRRDGSAVVGRDATGKHTEISLEGLRVTAGKATSTVRFTGNLSSTANQQTVSSVKVFDTLGQEHVLALNLTRTDAMGPGSWKLEVVDGTASVAQAQVVFTDGRPTSETKLVEFTYTPPGREAQKVTLDFSSDVTSFAAGSLSTLAASTQDGYAPGNLTKVEFNEAGTLVASYGNGQTVQGAQLALARFASPDAARDLGGNAFAEAGGRDWDHGVAGQGGFGRVRSRMLEMSNVDLSREFSELVVMQRGYQAASQVISTANDMVQELFGMRHK